MVARRRNAGFTLLELAMVAALLGAFATLAGTAVGSWVADARQQNAAYAVLKLAREAHDLAQRSGKARMIVFDQTASNGLGTLAQRSGLGPRCLKTPWAGVGDADVYDLATANPKRGVPTAGDPDRQVVRAIGMRDGVIQQQLSLCIEPSGRTYSQVVGQPLAVQTTLIVFQVIRTLDGADVGTPRNVLLPPGGRPRLQR